MTLVRLRILSLSLALAGLSLTGCKKEDPQPATSLTAQQQQLSTGSWRLDEIKQAGQVASSGSTIKDRYALTFRANGTYTQKLLADNTTYDGTWQLLNNNATLRITDQKGTSNDYVVASLSATTLRYTFTNKDNQAEERTFSAQP